MPWLLNQQLFSARYTKLKGLGQARIPASGPAPGAGATGTPVVSVDRMVQEDPSTGALLDGAEWHYRDPPGGGTGPVCHAASPGLVCKELLPPNMAVWRAGDTPEGPSRVRLKDIQEGQGQPLEAQRRNPSLRGSAPPSSNLPCSTSPPRGARWGSAPSVIGPFMLLRRRGTSKRLVKGHASTM